MIISSFSVVILALFELHLPRDIDSLRPLWKSLFKTLDDRKGELGFWLMNNIVNRVGIYGGLKVSDDPLSNLYGGFNYALTKELGINFGWIWSNTYKNQVTDISNIRSVSDALKYAKEV